MINQGINVPNNTIAIFKDPNISYERINNILEPLKNNKKRNWFDPHFYHCLPLTIGNTYGFVIKSEFDFAVRWNNGNSYEDLKFDFNLPQEKVDKMYPRIESHFGHGVITIAPPFTLRTPPGINLMTINPPNFILPNITVMTGVVESDNLRFPFTFNLKVQLPGMRIMIPAGTPLAAFIPVPRHFVDSFDLKLAEELFDKAIIDEENDAREAHENHRKNIEPTLPGKIGKLYMKGKDIFGNKFPDHQK
jgi:hypothetical protein